MRAIFLVVALLGADEPSMTGPDDVVPIGRSVWLEVKGVTVPELQNGDVSIYPSGYLESSHVRVLQDLRGMILVWVEIAKDNPLKQYDVVVTVARMEGDQPRIHSMSWRIKTGAAPNPPPDPPDPPPGPTQWKVEGLHCLIIDDENQRGKLPQAQVNIFTSKPLRDWLDNHAAKIDGQPAYRFSHPESLEAGSEGRKLEVPVFVDGWDILMKSGTKLPAWIVSDGKREVIEPLPDSVEAAIERLGGFK